MNPSAAQKGRSFGAVVRYVTHDIGAESAGRVGFVEVLNMRTGNPEKAAKVMAWTALHAAELKAEAGLKATGRKTDRPVYHFSLNWEPGATPTAAHMIDTAKAALAALGYERHEAVLAAHTDKDHPHLHVVVSRIDPETGKTHNPKDDYEALQRWAYDYEKAHGRVVCLERALKYERNPELKAEYQQRLAAEAEAGQQRDSKSRPEWEVEHDATHPKSQRYQEIKASFAARARELALAGRQAVRRRATEWEELKARQAEERARLAAKHQAAFRLRRAFSGAAKPEYSWKSYQADRAQLRKQQTKEDAALRAQIKAKDAPAVAAFKDGQKAAWQEFYRFERTEKREKPVQNVALVAATPVSRQGVEHRDHLARLFNATVTRGEREQQFATLLAAEKQAFHAGLAQENAPALAALKTRHQAQLQAVQERLAQARATKPEHFRKVYQADRAELRKQQAREHADLRAQIKAKDEPAVAAFKDEQKAAWREFYRFERTEKSEKLVKNVALVAATPVSRQGVEYRDHLARLFNATVTRGEREQQFAAHLMAEKQAFYAGLVQQNAPLRAALKTEHQAQFQALQGRLAQARAAGKERTEETEARREGQRAAYAALRREHRLQRDELSGRHGEEKAAQRQAWATLNSERASAWDSYKQARAEQQAAAEKKAAEKTRDGGDLYDNRRITGSDYSRTRSDAGREGGGRGDTGRQIAYKRSS